jgi:hypothetical protein
MLAKRKEESPASTLAIQLHNRIGKRPDHAEGLNVQICFRMLNQKDQATNSS